MDVLRLPLAGRILRWPRLRLTLQLALVAAIGAVVLHGLLGPQIAPRNLATVLTSVHWRGMLVVGVLLAGNLFCTACPMVLLRDGARRVTGPPRFRWPRALRGKWIGLTLLVAALFSYELFGLWERPAATAWVIAAYVAVALAVDVLFRGASFCKHVCPVGQFNFLASTLSPAEVRVRQQDVCRSCRTSDCIKGRRSVESPLVIVRRGCELGLFVPAKTGNLDCTLCLDCVHACPHDNVAIAARLPGAELIDDRRRSGLGRLGTRPDLAALAVVFTFAALLNAFAMTAPAHALERSLARAFQSASDTLGLALLFAAGLLVLPAVLLPAAAALTRLASGTPARGLGSILRTYAFALVPFGVGVWLAHYGFHLATGILAVVPVTQSAAIDLSGWAWLGEPAWSLSGMRPGAVYPLQLGVVMLGAAGSAGVVHALSRRDRARHPAAASAPWIAVLLAMTAAALWIFGQPMEMRGMGGVG